MNIGDRIRQLREQLGLTQEEVGNKIGVTKATVNRYETGEIDIKRTIAIKLADVLNSTPSYIMGWEPDPSLEESNKSPVSSFLAKKKVIADIKSSATNTYTIHGSQGKGSVVKSSIPKDKGILAYNEKIYELTQAEFTALEGVIKAMRNEIRD
ncbi:helix-turn-helix domain-containing protein [Congzhengia minquanensis]|uniref:Helix-turn-helix transcriptional regulator n=1 Tax=Congzhengia minquanensis TaxID=2763657 RepID=A0A926HYR5_9FIRM|nr:helix-turn-helix transcriptional regulator [Congzhengia minquanensis]MBC8540663.1 helix-turn-helix transcriptional regulator [Congzhengia minquanensis]